MDWPTGKYHIILADPPWKYRAWSRKGMARSAAVHYPTMSTAKIAALPVRDLARQDCTLFLWVPWPHLYESEDVIEGWGFEYSGSGFVWGKVNADGSPYMGLGHTTRKNTELCVEACILARKGAPPRQSRGVMELLLAQRREHSRKPDEIYERIMSLYDGPYLELFARQQWSGWDAWGNEVGKYVPEPSQMILSAEPEMGEPVPETEEPKPEPEPGPELGPEPEPESKPEPEEEKEPGPALPAVSPATLTALTDHFDELTMLSLVLYANELDLLEPDEQVKPDDLRKRLRVWLDDYLAKTRDTGLVDAERPQAPVAPEPLPQQAPVQVGGNPGGSSGAEKPKSKEQQRLEF